MSVVPSISTIRHPLYNQSLPEWTLWRDIWRGGRDFIEKYVEKLSHREDPSDFMMRKKMTPLPGFSKTAVTDVKNAVFQRMGDIIRKNDVSPTYELSVHGYRGGIDRRGTTMNNFIGTQVLPEMLFMGQVGVFVDNITPVGPTLADGPAKPFLYTYPVEDILSFRCASPESDSDFEAVLLRDWCLDFHTINVPGAQLPAGRFERLRWIWIGENGNVFYQFFTPEGSPITRDGVRLQAVQPIELKGIRRIPFVMFSIGDSLLRDIATHQITLTNLASSDISYALKSNIPFYTEQRDVRAIGSHLKPAANEDGTASTGGQGASPEAIRVGAVDGRIYPLNADRPAFIAPPSEPLQISMEIQKKLEDDIRKLISLAVVSLGSSRASGEARAFDNQGLESGLSFIGMVLEGGEKKIADHWSAYEGNNSRDTAVVKYPERYSLKSATERLEEAERLAKLMFAVPSTEGKKVIAKDIMLSLAGGRIKPSNLETIFNEINKNPFATSDPEIIRLAKEQQLAGDVTLSNALGFDGESEIPKAEVDHARRIERIKEAQSSEDDVENPGARGIADLDPTGGQQGEEERREVTDTTLQDSTRPRQRGRGRRVRT